LTKTKVLFVLHNHPTVRPGGAEMYAIELYEALKSSPHIEPMLVAGMQPKGPQPSGHPGTPFKTLPEDQNQYLVITEMEGFDFFLGTMRDKSLYTRYFDEFLRAHQPDVVHFQHTQFIGYDLVSLVSRVLPQAPILYTLHEYLPICHRDGQMLRVSGELCTHETPRRCNECYPHRSQQHFFLRKQLIQRHLSNVDLFLAPSRFLLERYADWGLPRDRLRFEDYGRLPAASPLPDVTVNGSASDAERPRNRLAFFGQVNRYKGLDVLLRAMKIVVKEHPDVQLWIHGANLDIQPEELQQDFLGSVEELEANVTFTGSYDHALLPELMSAADWVVVPSRWWENSPLVIQEAFQYGRPVICSDIGGMAEKVTDGVNGLHSRVGDPVRLAETIGRAIGTPGLWSQLQAGIPEIFSMEEHVGNLTGIYHDLIASKSAAKLEAEVVAEA
jgi:glycosyltransferase involved in cell wall biosynthesis